MSDIQTFSLWFIQNVPDFLMADPIKYVWGFILSAYILKVILFIRRS